MKCARREGTCEKYEKKERNKDAGGGREWLSGDLREESVSVEMVERRGVGKIMGKMIRGDNGRIYQRQMRQAQCPISSVG